MNVTLFVDDEPDMREVFCRGVGRFLSVEAAGSAAEALAMLESDSKKYGAVVTDLRMPVMGGMELLREVRDKYPTIRTFVLSGNATFENLVEAINEAGVDGYFAKPYSREDLVSTITRVLYGGSLI